MSPTKPLQGQQPADRDKQRHKHHTHSEVDPRAELGLKSPTKDAGADESDTEQKRQEAEGRKATQFDGNPNPQGAVTTALGPKDDTPSKLKKVEGPRDDQ